MPLITDRLFLPLITDPLAALGTKRQGSTSPTNARFSTSKNPANQPVILPTKFQFVINPATAKMLGRVEHPARPRR